MFRVDEESGTVELNSGDTGAWEMEAHRDDDEPWGENDIAVFTVRNNENKIVIQRIYHLNDEENGNGVFLILIQNSDTDDLPAGQYTWEVRYIVDPLYDEDGEPVDGSIVDTPGISGKGDPMAFNIKSVQKYI